MTFSLHLTQQLDYPKILNYLQVLHQIQLLVRHPRLLLSQINPTALQLLALMVGGLAESLLLWVNASSKVTSMVSINLALLFSSRLLGFATALASSSIYVFPPLLFTVWYLQPLRELFCLFASFPNFLGFTISPTPPSLLHYSITVFSRPFHVLLHSNAVPSHTCRGHFLITFLICGFPTLESQSHLSPLTWVTNRRPALTTLRVSNPFYGWEHFSHDRPRLYCALCLKPNSSCNNIVLVCSTLSFSILDPFT